MTFSQLNEYADTLENEGIIPIETLEDGDVMPKVCGVYQKVRPFLQVIAGAWFLPKKWRAPIEALMLVLDGLCPIEV